MFPLNRRWAYKNKVIKMKNLQRLFILLTVCTALFSCQKEYSNEVNVNASASAQWSFTEGTSNFKGPIDTVTFDSLGAYKILTITGHSSDNKGEISLQVSGPDFKVGTYKTPFSMFGYLDGNVLVYQNNINLADSFTIVITKLDSTGVAGTFSGKVYDSTKAYKTIVNGVFSDVFKTTAPPAAVDSGQVVVWSQAGCGGGTSTSPITVSVGGKTGQITTFSATAPSACDSTGGYYLKLPVGTYPVVVKCGTDSFSTTVTIVKNTCTKLEITLSGTGTSNDYFPTTAGSNWSYLNENSTPDDTMYTVCTGQTGTINGSPFTYNLFVNDYGSSGKDSSFYRKTIPFYYSYSPAYSDSTSSIAAYETTMLVDNIAAGTNFASSGIVSATLNGTSGTISLSSVIVSTGTTETVAGITYTSNVIKVKTTYAFKVGSTSTNISVVEQWFAKGVGLIKYIEYSDAPSFTTPDFTYDLTRFTVY